MMAGSLSRPFVQNPEGSPTRLPSVISVMMEHIDIFHSHGLKYSDWDALFCMNLDPEAVKIYCQAKKQLQDHPENRPDPPNWPKLLAQAKRAIANHQE